MKIELELSDRTITLDGNYNMKEALEVYEKFKDIDVVVAGHAEKQEQTVYTGVLTHPALVLKDDFS